MDTYQLLENGEPVSNGSNSLGMWSRNMPTGGEVNYTCMANNTAGTAYSMSLTVTVNGKQQIQIFFVVNSLITFYAWVLQYFSHYLFSSMKLNNYGFYKHYSKSLSAIDFDKGGIERIKLQPSLENW